MHVTSEGSGAVDARRRARRRETIEEIVGHAVDIMSVDGVVGLSLGEIARRMGVRTPSLYTYFDSKAALYDQLFLHGWEKALAELQATAQRLGPVTGDADVQRRVLTLTEAMTRWACENEALGQLMFWRPVPAFSPSPEAYAPSLEVMRMLREEIDAWVGAGLLAPDVDRHMLAEAITTAGAGIMTRKLANEPGVPYEESAIAPVLPFLLVHLVEPHLAGR